MLALLAALAASSPAAAPPAPPAAGPFAGIRNLALVRYDVRGTSWQEIGASIHAHALGRADGEDVAGRMKWQVGWRALSLVQGRRCRITGATLHYSITVTLPRLIGEGALDPSLQARWRAYAAGLARHEAGHARYAFDHVGDVRRAILSGDCAGVRTRAAGAIAAINRWETLYDVRTRHGETQDGASTPPPRTGR